MSEAELLGFRSISTVSSLDEVYSPGSLVREGKRWDDLATRFTEVYKHAPDYIARAPGRVNMIGEHIDYSLFSVLPAAIEADILIATKVTPSKDDSAHITVRNYYEDKYQMASIDFRPQDGPDGVFIDNSKHDWANYFRGLLTSIQAPKPVTIEALVWGTVPAGSGLSSSAALTCSSATACARAFGIANEISRKKLTEISIVGEGWAGVSMGGMDQAASVFGIRDNFILVDFIPSLLATPIKLPKTNPVVSIVIAHSLVVADKHTTSKYNYNLRVVETRLASIILSKHLGISPVQRTLKEVQDVYFKSSNAQPQTTQDQIKQLKFMEETIEKVFGNAKNGESWDVILNERLDGMSRQEFEKDIQNGVEIEANVLKLYMRSRHVFREAQRVYQFLEILQNTPTNTTIDAKELGKLMDQSQNSCKEDYQCSCPEIDNLIQISKEAGSLGSRLTGAGFGGCTVHLVPESLESSFISTLKDKYYGSPSISVKAANGCSFTQDELDAACFATKPGGGACLYELSK